MKGCDYSWDRPDLSCLYNNGARFVVRYGSRDPSKNLTKSELDAILAAGMSVAVVWQEGKTQMLRGYGGGVTDAKDAVALFNALGLVGIPIHFACDDDVTGYTSSQLGIIDDYCKGAASVVGMPRMGAYGAYAFIKRQFDGGRITFGWQTYAWSGGKWDGRAQLRQVDNDVSVCGGNIDWDQSMAPDFGQWPRESTEDFMSASTYWRNEGPYMTCVGNDGRPYYAGPDTQYKWHMLNENWWARSGADITAADDGRLLITFTNQDSDVCTAERKSGGGGWNLQNRGGDAK
jgi:Domain of unknown function (DUF1906)